MARGPAAVVISSFLVTFAIGCSDDVTPVTDTFAPDDAGMDFDAVPDPDQFVKPDGSDAQPPDLPPKLCQLFIESINTTPIAQIQVITPLMDKDSAKAGIQLDIVVAAIGTAAGTDVELEVTGLTPVPKEKTDTSGKASFTGVTVSTSLTTVTMTPKATNCDGKREFFSVVKMPTCQIKTPADKATLFKKDDKIPGTTAFEHDVEILTANGIGGTIELKVGGSAVGSPKTILGPFGNVTFPTVTFGSGSNALEAEVKVTVGTDVLSAKCTSSVDVSITNPTCTLKGPTAKSTTKGDGLGPNEDEDTSATGLQASFSVTTDTTVTSVVLKELKGNPVQTWTVTPSGGTAAFSKLTIPEGAREFQATCTVGTSGSVGTSAKASYVVDVTNPPAVTDLACSVTHNRKGEITCTWKSVDDGASGSGVEKYEIKYHKNAAISATTFGTATTATKSPVAANAAGVSQSLVEAGLTMPDSFAFAVKAYDVLGNVSTISNLPTAQKVDFKTQQLIGAASSAFGFPVVVGDFNCDTYSDLAVGLNNSNSGMGEVQLFFSTGAGLPTAASKKISGTIASGNFGWKLAALDYDNDKCADLAVMAVKHDSGRGKVYLYLGRTVWSDRDDVTTGKGAEIIYQLATTASADEVLGSVLTTADVDGDGKQDLAMRHHITTGTKWADVLVDYGEANITKMTAGVAPIARTMPATADLQVTGGFDTDKFSRTIEGCGLLNADTYEEICISAPGTKISGVKRGAAYILTGKAASTTKPEVLDITTSTRVIRIDGGSTNSGFSLKVGGVGDIDGDGTPDFIASDTLMAVGGDAKAGVVYLFDLKGATPATVADAKAVISNDLGSPTTTPNFFGRSFANGAIVDSLKGADVNKDGYADMIFGSMNSGANPYGSAFMFYGKAGTTNTTTKQAGYTFVPGAGGTTFYANTTIFASDMNGDGYVDIVIGESTYSSSAGRVITYY
jgi:hypothetical protein